MSRLSETVDRIQAEGEGSSDPSSPEAPRRKRGRPPGSGKNQKAKVAQERAPYVANEASITMSALLGSTLWRIVSTFAPFRGLTEDEAMQLGTALDPILWKYVPMIADWQAELNLAIVIVTLVNNTKIEKPKPVPVKAEEPIETTETYVARAIGAE